MNNLCETLNVSTLKSDRTQLNFSAEIIYEFLRILYDFTSPWEIYLFLSYYGFTRY